MNKQGYFHNHPQHRQRTKAANHPRNHFRLIWCAFEKESGFNFDQEQMGLPPPLSFSFSYTHTQYIHTPDQGCPLTRTHNHGRKSRLLQSQRGRKLINFFSFRLYKRIKVATQQTSCKYIKSNITIFFHNIIGLLLIPFWGIKINQITNRQMGFAIYTKQIQQKSDSSLFSVLHCAES